MIKKINPRLKKKLNQVLLVLGGIILIFVILFGGIKTNDYYQVNKLVKASEDLVKQEKYQDANNKLALTQSRWTTSKVRKDIETNMTLNSQFIADADSYAKGNDLFGQSKWQEAKDAYVKISDKFTHYKEAQDKLRECQTKIDEVNAKAEAEKQAEEQKTEQSRTQKSTTNTAANDPFPVHPGYGECDGVGSGEPFNGEKISCEWSVNNKYKAAMAEWYARHGQTAPSQTKTSCRWVLDTWTCTTN